MLKKLLLAAGVISLCLVLWHSSFTSMAYAQSTSTAPSENIDAAGFAFPLAGTGSGDDTGIVHPNINPQNWIRYGINYIFSRIIQVLASVIGGLSVLVMVFGGFLILTSAGSENQYQKGINYIKYSLIGLAFTLLAYMLVLGVQLIIRSIYP